MIPAVSSYCFYPYISEGKMTEADTPKAAHELGFEDLEVFKINGNVYSKGEEFSQRCETARKIKKEADKYGIKIIAYTTCGTLYKETEEEFVAEIEMLKREVDIAEILGAPLMRHDTAFAYGKTPAGRSFELMLPSFVKAARAVTEYAQTKGIKTCTENHGFIVQDSDRVERFVNEVNRENFGLLVDMANFLAVDEDPVLAVSRLAPYAFHVHTKDIIVRNKPCSISQTRSRGGADLICVSVGEGDIPVERCLRSLKLAGYNSYVAIEYEGCLDCMKGVSISKRNLERIIAALD